MKISDFTSSQVRRYFETRIPNHRFKAERSQQVTCCPFHEDQNPSLSLDFEKAVWNCHGGCGAGGLIEFEMRVSHCDNKVAWRNICSVLGIEWKPPQRQVVAVYKYTDERGHLLFDKLRYEPKDFSQRRPDGQGGYKYTLDGTRKVLYHLPEVITSNWVCFCEGEKDADRINSLNLASYDKTGATRLVATTNFDGAGKWRAEYAPYFAGKCVAIFPDNDEQGRQHARVVAESVSSYALSTRVVNLPGLPEKGDVSNYLDGHSAEELISQIKAAPLWKATRSNLLIPAEQFGNMAHPEIDWLVEPIIERGSNGFICADPHVGKSWLAVDLALSLALGVPWLDFLIRSRVKTALISREDNPNLTAWRQNNILRGKNKTYADVGDWLWVNSKSQSREFKLDIPEQLTEMIAELKAVRPEFVILDVLNVLHNRDENDNTEMRAVLNKAELMHRELGCSVCILHHFNKSGEGSLVHRLRGSSAIAGFGEFIMGISRASDDEADPTRCLEFDIKASSPIDRVNYWVNSDHMDLGIRVQRVEGHKNGGKRGREEDSYVQ